MQQVLDTQMRTIVQPADASILLVEDDVSHVFLAMRMMAITGVGHYEWKTSGWEVVRFAEVLPRLDLILMDVRLPYEDGYRVLHRLRAHPRLNRVPVCAVTAEASDEYLRRARKGGFDSFIGKPLRADRFPHQLRAMLSGQPVWEWR